MNVLIPLLAGGLLFILATRTYAFYVSRRLGLDDTQPPPSERMQDGRDYVPTRTHVVFAHHFSVIAGAGPIVGPVMALVYGWGPAWLWIIIGCILFGAVHDMSAMFVSMREDGRSIADMSRRCLGTSGYLLFVAFVIMILTLINAIFLNLSCKALTASYPAALLKIAAGDSLLTTFMKDGVLMGRIGGIATTSVFVITVFAPLLGWMIYKKRYPILPLYILASLICILSVVLGFYCPILLTENIWRYVMSVYIFFACWVPVWLILQPRDFINVQILYAGLLLMLGGVLLYGFSGHHIGTGMFTVAEGEQRTGPIWPFLLITVACGAISGFHSLAATGTTVKQIAKESEVRRVGYNAMILEGALALLALLLVATALPRHEYFNIVFPANADGNPILAFSVAMGYMLHDIAGVKVAFGCVLGILVLEGFVVTTLDTSVRLCRYMLEELWTFAFHGRPPALFKNAFFNTAIAVALMLFFALTSTIMAAWKVFGAGNQLIAALAMTVVTVWLLQKGRSFWFTIVPAIVMCITTFATLGIIIAQNLGQAPAGAFVAPGQGPLTFAAALLLALSLGVLLVAVRKFRDGRGGGGEPPRAQSPVDVEGL
ncbi:MAG: carbon starvation protein A [Kiritimatiellaeota bacterium]|nr:carbon starvation protein A [Kiritimatiellota bacterium]